MKGRYNLPLPPALQKELNRIADKDHRSLAQQIVWFLEQAVAEYQKEEKETKAKGVLNN